MARLVERNDASYITRGPLKAMEWRRFIEEGDVAPIYPLRIMNRGRCLII